MNDSQPHKIQNPSYPLEDSMALILYLILTMSAITTFININSQIVHTMCQTWPKGLSRKSQLSHTTIHCFHRSILPFGE